MITKEDRFLYAKIEQNRSLLACIKNKVDDMDISTLAELIQWNEDNEITEVKIDGSFVPVNIPTGTYIAEEDILHGDLIYVSGVAGVSGKIKCSKFINDGSIESKYYVGVAVNDTLNGEIGLFYSGIGAIRGIDTSTYNEGDVLYPSETVAGGYQTEIPTNAIIPFGIVLVKNAVNGVIAVRWQPESVKEASETTKGIADFPMMREAVATSDTVTSLETGDEVLIKRLVSGVPTLLKADKDLFGGGIEVETDPVFNNWVANSFKATEMELGDGVGGLGLEASDNQSSFNIEMYGRHMEYEQEVANKFLDYIQLTEKGVALGVVPLGADTKIPTQYLPDNILGQVEYKGTWNALTDTPTIPVADISNKGWYYVVDTDGTYNSIDFKVGDWIISDGTKWDKVDNTDAVTTVFGRLGNISALEADYEAFYPKLGTVYNNPSWIGALDWNKIQNVPQFDYVPYTGATADVNLGAHKLTLGIEEVIVDKAKHQTFIYEGNEPILRHQTYYWSGSSYVATHCYGFGLYALKNNTGYYSNGFGYYSLQSNTGTSSNGFGNNSLQNNTGSLSNGFGHYSLQNNTGTSSNGFGNNSLQNNTGSYSNGFGYQSLQNNIGSYSNGFGHYSLQNNTGSSSNGFGYYSLQNNTGSSSNGFGYQSLQNNTGSSSNGFGYYSLQNNTGTSSNGFGNQSLQNNTGSYSDGFGYYSLQNNTGSYSDGFGYYSLQNNTGSYSNGFGNNSLMFNQKNNNTAIGYNAYSSFIENTSNNKTFDYTAINATTDRITIPSHGFGENGTWVNVKYTQGTSYITGLVTGNVYQIKIIDSNTISFREIASGTIYHGKDISNAGTGTGHILTPQYAYENTTCLGANTSPTKNNQVILGDSNVTEVLIGTTLAIDKNSIVAAADGTPLYVRIINGVKTITI